MRKRQLGLVDEGESGRTRRPRLRHGEARSPHAEEVEEAHEEIKASRMESFCSVFAFRALLRGFLVWSFKRNRLRGDR